MKLRTKPEDCEAHQILPEFGWWETLNWLDEHGVDATMIINTKRIEEDRFVLHTPLKDIEAGSYDWIVITSTDIRVYDPYRIDLLFEQV